MKKKSFFILAILLVLAAPASTAFAELSVSYRGLTSTHLNYAYTATGADDIGVRLVVQNPNGSETQLDPESGPPTALTLQGKKLHDNLQAGGTYIYSIRVVSEASERIVETRTATLNNTVSGELLFDETIDGPSVGIDPVVSQGIEVPANVTLSIEGTTTMTGSSIEVTGTLAMSPDANTKALAILLYAPQNFPEVSNAKLIFGSGSSGSVVAKGKDLIIYPNGGNLTVSHVENLVLEDLQVMSGVVSLGYVKPWLVDNLAGDVVFPAGAKLALDHVEVSYPTDYPYSDLYLYLKSDGEFDIQECIFHEKIGVGFYGKKPKNITVKKTKFRRACSVIGGAPLFEDCEFAGQVTLHNRTAARFAGNIFAGPLRFANTVSQPGTAWTASGDTPEVTGNSFVGPEALIYADVCSFTGALPGPIPIGGDNYYGDALGFVPKADPCAPNTSTFLRKRGALVTEYGIPWYTTPPAPMKIFDIPGSAPTGKTRTDKAVLPSFWLISSAAGQTTLPHTEVFPAPPMIQGRETLFSVDVGCTDDDGVEGVRIFAKVDGTSVQSQEVPAIRRDTASYQAKKAAVFLGFTTVNFALPPVNKSQAKVDIYLDCSQIKGYDIDGDGVDDGGSASKWLLSKTLNFDPPYGRPLNILFHTVAVIRGFGSDDRTERYSLTKTKQALSNLLPSLLPLGTADLNLMYSAEVQAASQANTITGLLRDLAPPLEIHRRLYERANGVAIDFHVAVLPKGMMGGYGGANLPERREILFVDESKLSAVVHEMGHGIGLYRSPEQYDQYPPDGLPFTAMTAFVSEAGKGPSWIAGTSRVRHLVATDHPAYQNWDWMDLMSKSDDSIWPIPSTLSGFYSFLRQRLGTGTTTNALTHGISLGAVPMEENTRRVFIRGETTRVIEGDTAYYRLEPGTLRAMELGAYLEDPLPAETSGTGEAYRLEAFNASGASVHVEDFLVKKTNPYFGDEAVEQDIWYATFDLPQSTARYTVTRVDDGEVCFDIHPAEGLSIQMLQPANGTTLGDTIDMAWNTTFTAAPTGQPLQYALFYSTDGGESWDLLAFPVESTALDLPTDVFPSGDDLSLRVVASDGLTTAEARIDGLVVENRAPVVEILMPLEGDQAVPETAWSLAGNALDVEDGTITSGVWESSLDGVLGTGPGLDHMVLTPGDHAITYSATDSDGLTETAEVHVTVGPMDTIDLRFDEDALKVSPPGRDPLDSAPVILKISEQNRCTLKIRNTGTNSAFDVKLHLLPPGGAESLIAQEQLSLGPFETYLVEVTFNVDAEGEYRFRATIENVAPADSDMENNERTWFFYTEPTAIAVLSPAGGETWKAGSSNTIEWSYTGFPGSFVTIDLLKAGSVVRNITPQTVMGSGGLGTFTWPVPRDLVQGEDYTIRLTGTGGSLPQGVSANSFNISGPDPALVDAIVCLQVMSGCAVVNEDFALIQDITGDGKIGLEEAMHILKKVSGLM